MPVWHRRLIQTERAGTAKENAMQYIPGRSARELPEVAVQELEQYEERIREYRAGKLDETKMQKTRLHFGTYAQRQEGVQMQRIKFPGGLISSDQLVRLADAADKFGSGFIHFTTREDAQLYYVKLEETPAMLRYLAETGITTREACGNTVRNITSCYRAGTSPTEPFDVSLYSEVLYEYLIRNKYNQNLGRKFKITFEGCNEDHSGLRIHDIGFQATSRGSNGSEQRGFRVFLGGGLGGAPHLGTLYTEFLPVEEMFAFTAAVVRVFDRYGERKSRMKARMKFLVQTMGWEAFTAAIEEERSRIGLIPGVKEAVDEKRRERFEPPASLREPGLNVLDDSFRTPAYQDWVQDNVVLHKKPGLRGVHVRLKLGDLIADQARNVAEIARRFSSGQLRISIEQNLYLPFVPAGELPGLFASLKEAGLADAGAETAEDVTTCPGADTCRLGIASAKGLGSRISDAFAGELALHADLARDLKIKISGCPNGCAQHTIANIGFHAAAMTGDGKTIPAYLVFAGGEANGDRASFGRNLGRIPARNGVAATGALLSLYREEKLEDEDFNSCLARLGEDRLKDALEPYRHAPAFSEDPSFYQDWDHENEKFAVRQGVRGECAGATVAETVPTMDSAAEWLAQADAYLYHKEYASVLLAAYEAAGAAARVPLYSRLVDPFTSNEALWEFENLFVLSGETRGEWTDLWKRAESWKEARPDETEAKRVLEEARKFVDYCRQS